MPAFIVQPSMTGGEVAPSLHARQDLAKFGVSLKTCINWIIHAHGGGSNRAGTQFVGEVKDSTKVTRLIPFSFSTTQTYSLEFGDQILRVIKDGGYVIDTSSPPDIYELATTYLEADLPLLKFTQSADVMTITHPSYPDRELTRTDHDAWTITNITRGTAVAAPTGHTATPTGMGTGDTYEYKITAVIGGDESLPSTSASATGAVAWPAGGYVTVAWSAVSDAEYYNVYKRSFGAGSFGFIGTSDTVNFIDDNIQQEYNQTPPPSNNNPFPNADNYPSCVAYFQERIVYANTNNKPQTTWFSKTGVYHNMNVSVPPRDDDSIEATVAAREVNAIRHLVPMNKALIAFTTGYPWVFKGPTDGGGVTPNNLQADPQGKRGASHVPPLVIGSQILFVQDKGSVIRDFSYTFEKDLYDGTDVSILANHLFEGRAVKEWAYSEVPHSIIWCVMDDGDLIGFTYLKEHEVWGWHRHDTDGTVESVCSISEGNEDAVYFIINRPIGGVPKRYVERLHSRAFADIRDAFFVDSGLSLDDPTAITGITQADPAVVTAGAHGRLDGEIVDLSDIIGMSLDDEHLNDHKYKVANKTTNTFELTHHITDAGLDTTGYSAYTSGGFVREAVTSISGLDHLEGKTVAILADGNVHAQKVVTSGAITLDYAAARVHVGLPYVSDIETLPSDFVGDNPSYGRKRIVSEIVLHLLNSRGFWSGYDVDHLTEFKQRGIEGEDYHDPVALITGKAHLTVDAKWREEGTMFVRQMDPLPVTILSIAPGVDLGA